MASIGPSYFSTTVTQSTIASPALPSWSSPDNSRLNDGSFASVSVTSGVTGTYPGSQVLFFKLSDLGLPSDQQVFGVQITLYTRQAITNTGGFYCQLCDGNSASPTFYGSRTTIAQGSANTWTINSRSLTPSGTQMTTNWWNGSTGYLGLYTDFGSTQVYDVDYIQVTVTYGAYPTNSTGNTLTTSGSTITGIGTIAWTNPGNITAIDTNFANVVLTTTQTSNYLVGNVYGFNIPANSTIIGVTANVRARSNATIGTGTTNFRLWSANTALGTSKTQTLTSTSTFYNFGSNIDTWGATLTAATVNSSGFGLAIWQSPGTFGTGLYSIESVQLNIYYTPPVNDSANCSVVSSFMLLGAGK